MELPWYRYTRNVPILRIEMANTRSHSHTVLKESANERHKQNDKFFNSFSPYFNSHPENVMPDHPKIWMPLYIVHKHTSEKEEKKNAAKSIFLCFVQFHRLLFRNAEHENNRATSNRKILDPILFCSYLVFFLVFMCGVFVLAFVQWMQKG